MKVIYKRRVLDQIVDAIAEATDSNNKIDYIEATPEEMKELDTHLSLTCKRPALSGHFFFGVEIREAK